MTTVRSLNSLTASSSVGTVGSTEGTRGSRSFGGSYGGTVGGTRGERGTGTSKGSIIGIVPVDAVGRVRGAGVRGTVGRCRECIRTGRTGSTPCGELYMLCEGSGSCSGRIEMVRATVRMFTSGSGGLSCFRGELTGLG